MTWRLARSLETLREQANSMAPGRSKLSDGSIGDPAHSSRTSDHNPDDDGVVRAIDLTHDPKRGFDAHAFADRLLIAQDPRLKYLISDGRIGSGPGGRAPGVWRRYDGSNPHDKHAHISVVPGARADREDRWAIGPRPVLKAAPTPAPVQEDTVLLVIVDSTKSVWQIRPWDGTRKRVDASVLALLTSPPKHVKDETALKDWKVTA